ncbi:hypothetical protein CYMTET_36063, partial [Cymbomonas tetramitiformis]
MEDRDRWYLFRDRVGRTTSCRRKLADHWCDDGEFGVDGSESKTLDVKEQMWKKAALARQRAKYDVLHFSKIHLIERRRYEQLNYNWTNDQRRIRDSLTTIAQNKLDLESELAKLDEMGLKLERSAKEAQAEFHEAEEQEFKSYQAYDSFYQQVAQQRDYDNVTINFEMDAVHKEANVAAAQQLLPTCAHRASLK